ncbi:MAG: SRPBCC family protein [Cyanobacteria bacterium P01_F01_bin.150]
MHLRSTSHTHERAVGGLTSGLLGLNDTVTWEATHLGVRQQLTSRITVCNPPYFFQDRMVSGAFQSFTHNHYFRVEKHMTVVTDHFDYESPFGLVGIWFNQLVLTNYMSAFLRRRLDIVKHIAESDEWQHYLSI